MKKKTQLKMCCIILAFLGAVHYFYTSPKEIPSISKVPFTASQMLIISPLLLYVSLLASKKTHTVDHSHLVNFIGILFFISSYAIYFIYFFTDLQNDILIGVFAVAFLVYYLFLTSYKGLWTS